MIELLDLINDVMAETNEMNVATDRGPKANEPHACDGCGEATPDVDLWAESWETGERLWLCLECGC